MLTQLDWMRKNRINHCPRLSVIVPVYNAERYVAETIKSILTQEFNSFELIVIDDGSSDRSLEIIREFRDPRLLLILNERNKGLIYSINRGLSLARGDYATRVDHDDLCYHGRFATQVAFLDNNPSTGAVGSWAEIVDERGIPHLKCVVPIDPDRITDQLLEDNCFVSPSVMFRLKLVMSLGGYREAAALAEDYDLWLRIGEKAKLANIPKVLVGYRVHDRQQSIRKIRAQRVAANLARRDAIKRRAPTEAYRQSKGWSTVSAKRKLAHDYVNWASIYERMGRRWFAQKLRILACIVDPFWLASYRSIVGGIARMARREIVSYSKEKKEFPDNDLPKA